MCSSCAPPQQPARPCVACPSAARDAFALHRNSFQRAAPSAGRTAQGLRASPCLCARLGDRDASRPACRRPAVSVAYERGWRQGFAWAGFPGADEEYQYAMEYLRPQYGRTLVDMSCGSGLFTRRFAKSGKFDGVIASDFSESMLSQTYDFIEQDSAIDATSVLLLRADVGRLPFATGSVAAVHAGAQSSYAYARCNPAFDAPGPPRASKDAGRASSAQADA